MLDLALGLFLCSQCPTDCLSLLLSVPEPESQKLEHKKTHLFRSGFYRSLHCLSKAYSAATCFAKLDFKLEAFFLWMILRFASLSNIETTCGNNSVASVASVVPRNLLTALRVVLW